MMQGLSPRIQSLSLPKSVNPASKHQWLSAVLSNPVLRGAVIALFALLSLGGCTLRPKSWDSFVSGAKTLKLFTFLPCDSRPQGIPEHETYYHAWYFEPYVNGAYWIDWADSTGEDNGGKEIYITAVWHIGLDNYTDIKPAYPEQDEQNPKCAALLVLPWSEKAKGPFFVESKPGDLLQQAHVSLFLAGLTGVLTAALLLVACGYAAAGYGKDELEKTAACTIALLAQIALNALAWGWCLLTTDKIEQLKAYYQFFDSLPRGAIDDLLPLSWVEVHRLIAGPPFPSETYIDLRPFYVLLAASSFVWLVAQGRAIIFGLYCVHTDPFRDLRAKARRRGTPPKPDELMAVIADATVTKGAWELEVLGRRARALGLSDRRRRRQ
jgi:hypothetical protein